MKRILISVFALFLLLSLSSAIGATYMQPYELKRTCTSQGAYCSSGATCNLTILFPDGTTFINNQAMTNQVTYFNYTINSGLLSQTGDYEVNINCIDNGLNGTEIFPLPVTGTSNFLGLLNFDFSQPTAIIIFIIALIISVLIMLFVNWELGDIFIFIWGFIALVNYVQIGIIFGLMIILSSIIIAFIPHK